MKYNCNLNIANNPNNCRFIDSTHCMLNKSVYYKMYYNQYFTSFDNAKQLDLEIVPNELISFITISNKNKFRNKVLDYFINNYDEDTQILINNILIFYNQLQLRFNYLNLGKCCSQLQIPDWNPAKADKYLTCLDAHDMFVYLFYDKNNNFSYFYNIVLVAQKIQKFTHKNFRKHNKITKYKVVKDCNDCKNSINCKKIIN